MDLPLLLASFLALTLTFYVILDGFDLTADEMGKLMVVSKDFFVPLDLTHFVPVRPTANGTILAHRSPRVHIDESNSASPRLEE